MGRGAIARAKIAVTPMSQRSGETPSVFSGNWNLSIIKGPLMLNPDPSTRITLRFTPDDGSEAFQIEIDPSSSTIDTIFQLGKSGAPVLSIMFLGSWNAIVD